MKRFLVVCMLALLPAGTSHADVAIGMAGPMTGPYAVFGEQMRRGVDQAVNDINALGGINGERLVVHTVDDACDPKQAVIVANQLASTGVKFVVGHFCSGASIPASKVYSEEGMFMISPSSTNPALTDAGLTDVFRVCGRDDQQGSTQANYILKHYPGLPVAIIHDNSTAGRGQADEFRKTINAAGVKEVLFESYMPGDRDYSALISKLKQAKAQVLDIGGYHTEAGLITRQLKEQAAQIQVIGGDALMTDEFWSITGPAGEGVLMTFGPDPRNKPEAAHALEALKKGGFDPEGYTLYSYAAVQVIAEGMLRANGTDPVAVANAVRRPQPISTVLGPISFNNKGDVVGSTYVVYRWHNGRYAETGN